MEKTLYARALYRGIDWYEGFYLVSLDTGAHYGWGPYSDPERIIEMAAKHGLSVTFLPPAKE